MCVCCLSKNYAMPHILRVYSNEGFFFKKLHRSNMKVTVSKSLESPVVFAYGTVLSIHTIYYHELN